MIQAFPKPRREHWENADRRERLSRRKRVTLIAGFSCPDGLVIAADTAIEYGPINFQNSKIQRTFSDKYGYTLTIGGAGHVSYFTMASQKIRDEIAILTDPTLATIKDVIDKTISEVHEKYIFKHWDAAAEERPRFDLIIGINDGNGGSKVLRSDNVALMEVRSYDFIGSGSSVAHLVAERLITPGLSTAVTLHLGKLCTGLNEAAI
jgi:20S proteasome alpha/beta subunit